MMLFARNVFPFSVRIIHSLGRGDLLRVAPPVLYKSLGSSVILYECMIASSKYLASSPKSA